MSARDLGGIEAIVRIIKTHIRHPDVCGCGCNTLENMVNNNCKTKKKENSKYDQANNKCTLQ